MWSKMLMLKLPIEEAERPNADMTVSVVTTRTPAGRRRDTSGRNNGNQNHGELWHNLCYAQTAATAGVEDAATSKTKRPEVPEQNRTRHDAQNCERPIAMYGT